MKKLISISAVPVLNEKGASIGERVFGVADDGSAWLLHYSADPGKHPVWTELPKLPQSGVHMTMTPPRAK